MPTFNNRIKQVLLLLLIILMLILVIRELYLFLPGILGALTLYILSRASYFQMVYHRKWKKGWAAGLFLLYYTVLIGIPVYLAISLISPKINAFLADPEATIESAKSAITAFQEKTGFNFVSEGSLTQSLGKLTEILPTLLNSTATLITNLAIMLFFLYYMLVYGSESERKLNRIIPLKQENINMLAYETKRMVKANALGIPLISIIQGAVAALGYYLFGVQEWGLWGFLTGVFAFFPVVGTMIVWVPIVIFMYASGDNAMATWLLIYSVVVTGNIDYVARITLLRRMGDVHPVITVLGVIVGLGLFGFIGLIFGPLLVSYVILLFNVYVNEFIDESQSAELVDTGVKEGAGEDKKSTEEMKKD